MDATAVTLITMPTTGKTASILAVTRHQWEAGAEDEELARSARMKRTKNNYAGSRATSAAAAISRVRSMSPESRQNAGNDTRSRKNGKNGAEHASARRRRRCASILKASSACVLLRFRTVVTGRLPAGGSFLYPLRVRSMATTRGR